MNKNPLLRVVAIVIYSTLLLSISCSKKSEIIENPKKIPTPTEFNLLRESALKDITQTKTFKAEDGLSFTGAKGAEIEFSGGCLQNQNGATVTGDVQLSFIEIYDRGTMTLTNKPVMGKNSNGEILPLITGGQYYIKITQGNEELRTDGCYFQVQIPTANTGGADREMILWEGTINEEGNLVYEEIEVGKEIVLNINEQGTMYSIWGDAFGWTNIDKFYDDPRPKTKIKVTVPQGYTGKNSGVYLAYEDQPNLLAQLDVYNTAEKYFTEHYGLIPIGLNVNVIFVSENKGAVAYAIKKVKIEANATINIADTDIKTASKSEVISLINNLK